LAANRRLVPEAAAGAARRQSPAGIVLLERSCSANAQVSRRDLTGVAAARERAEPQRHTILGGNAGPASRAGPVPWEAARQGLHHWPPAAAASKGIQQLNAAAFGAQKKRGRHLYKRDRERLAIEGRSCPRQPQWA